MKEITYKDSGVNLKLGNFTISRIKPIIHSTFNNNVISHIGTFSSIFDLKNILNIYKHPLMVQSMDGIGTKSIIAKMANQFYNLGIDLVSACSNDILTLGAKTLTLLDYISTSKLNSHIVEEIVKGMVDACKKENIALVGGELAEMPGIYIKGEYDIVGIATGIIEKEKIINGNQIQIGDKIIGFLSNGLHTNGFSLARKLLFDIKKFRIHQYIKKLGKTLDEVLLEPHINYSKLIHKILKKEIFIKGMAHITGGGIIENIPRILPFGCGAEIKIHSWPIPPIFSFLCQIGNLSKKESYSTFNMGIGWIIILSKKSLAQLKKKCKDISYFVIGKVIQDKHNKIYLKEIL